ncbi:hypothetical protein C7M84_019553 [Penaeus vannamei]|uniref:Uncharacterized protein n=1 Tax=Penaeus vannamei TaxID=6689 RepID=A0A3R7MIJ8_PENVA|nr:hypothetical protein C7M84_019553 [Penaeus vannamei]
MSLSPSYPTCSSASQRVFSSSPYQVTSLSSLCNVSVFFLLLSATLCLIEAIPSVVDSLQRPSLCLSSIAKGVAEFAALKTSDVMCRSECSVLGFVPRGMSCLLTPSLLFLSSLSLSSLSLSPPLSASFLLFFLCLSPPSSSSSFLLPLFPSLSPLFPLSSLSFFPASSFFLPSPYFPILSPFFGSSSPPPLFSVIFFLLLSLLLLYPSSVLTIFSSFSFSYLFHGLFLSLSPPPFSLSFISSSSSIFLLALHSYLGLSFVFAFSFLISFGLRILVFLSLLSFFFSLSRSRLRLLHLLLFLTFSPLFSSLLLLYCSSSSLLPFLRNFSFSSIPLLSFLLHISLFLQSIVSLFLTSLFRVSSLSTSLFLLFICLPSPLLMFFLVWPVGRSSFFLLAPTSFPCSLLSPYSLILSSRSFSLFSLRFLPLQSPRFSQLFSSSFSCSSSHFLIVPHIFSSLISSIFPSLFPLYHLCSSLRLLPFSLSAMSFQSPSSFFSLSSVFVSHRHVSLSSSSSIPSLFPLLCPSLILSPPFPPPSSSFSILHFSSHFPFLFSCPIHIRSPFLLLPSHFFPSFLPLHLSFLRHSFFSLLLFSSIFFAFWHLFFLLSFPLHLIPLYSLFLSIPSSSLSSSSSSSSFTPSFTSFSSSSSYYLLSCLSFNFILLILLLSTSSPFLFLSQSFSSVISPFLSPVYLI